MGNALRATYGGLFDAYSMPDDPPEIRAISGALVKVSKEVIELSKFPCAATVDVTKESHDKPIRVKSTHYPMSSRCVTMGTEIPEVVAKEQCIKVSLEADEGASLGDEILLINPIEGEVMTAAEGQTGDKVYDNTLWFRGTSAYVQLTDVDTKRASLSTRVSHISMQLDACPDQAPSPIPGCHTVEVSCPSPSDPDGSPIGCSLRRQGNDCWVSVAHCSPTTGLCYDNANKVVTDWGKCGFLGSMLRAYGSGKKAIGLPEGGCGGDIFGTGCRVISLCAK